MKVIAERLLLPPRPVIKACDQDGPQIVVKSDEYFRKLMLDRVFTYLFAAVYPAWAYFDPRLRIPYLPLICVLFAFSALIRLIQMTVRFTTTLSAETLRLEIRCLGLPFADRTRRWSELGEAELASRGTSEVKYWRVRFADGSELPFVFVTDPKFETAGFAHQLANERAILVHLERRVGCGPLLRRYRNLVTSAPHAST